MPMPSWTKAPSRFAISKGVARHAGGQKIKVLRKYFSTFQSTYTYYVQCAHKTPSQNSTYMRRFTSNPPIFGVSGRKIKINRNFLGMLRDFPVHLYILCAVCTQDTFPKFDLYEAFYVKSAYFWRFGRKIKINRKFLGMLSHFQSTYTYCVECAHKTPSQNSTSRRRFTSNPPFFRVFGQKIKLNRNFVGSLSHFPVHLYLLCGVCTKKTKSKFDF
ncbi:unnamed protein product [Trifolium pratense]|uniref:Uncharacterized protein n=1 Tax=Trifolium pratense TaxID=57577 RepID=A0ACB0L6X4_TRIPR|nr:unnamed protein product [Trifolium pratense]